MIQMKYSVLIAVYKKENPQYFNAALCSILKQTLPADEIVLVCDGLLTESLESVIQKHIEDLQVIRLPQSIGLGKALSKGLRYCNNEWVARMDSDDLSVANRCADQIEYLQTHPEVDVLSGVIAEFEGEAETVESAKMQIISYKKVPVNHSEICNYIKYRNPVNHPCVMFKKSKVLEAGGYKETFYFEDYDLWIRMYQKGNIFANMEKTLLLMRINDMHKRRGGWKYAKAILQFRKAMYQRHIITFSEYVITTGIRISVSLLPNRIRKVLYDKTLRK